MTNSSLRFALKGACVVSALVLAGCGKEDGTDELADGMDAYEVRDLKKADKLFEKSIDQNAENVDALVASALVKLELGKIQEAKAALAKAAELAGADDDVILLGAQIAYHAKDYKAASAAFAQFAADPKRDPKRRADAYVGLAVVEMTGNGNDRARVTLLKAMQLDRHGAAARYHLGIVYRDLGYEEAALEQFEAYAMLEKEDAVHVQRVQRQLIPALKAAIAHKAASRPGVDKRDSAAAAKFLQTAEAEWKKGNFKTAKLRYADALKADPLSYPAALGLAQAWEKTDTTAGGRRNALTCYQTACGLKPSAIKTLVKTGALAASLGNVSVAAEAYSRALAADPKNIDAIDGYIRALCKKGPDSERLARTAWQGYRDQLKRK